MEASPSGLRCVRAPVNRSHRPSGGPNDGGTVQWYTILQEPRDWQSDSLTGGHLHKCPATAAAHPGTLPVHGPAARDRLGWSRRTGVGWLVDPRARHRARPARRPCSTTRASHAARGRRPISMCRKRPFATHESADPAGAALEFRPGGVPASQSPAPFVSGCSTRTSSPVRSPTPEFTPSNRARPANATTRPPWPIGLKPPAASALVAATAGWSARALPASKTEGGGLTDCPRSWEPAASDRYAGTRHAATSETGLAGMRARCPPAARVARA